VKLLCTDKRVAAIVARNLPDDSSSDTVIIVRLPAEINIVRQMLKDGQTTAQGRLKAVVAFGLDMMPTISLINILKNAKGHVPLLIGAGGSLGDINNPKPLDVLLKICMQTHTLENILAKLPPVEAL